MSCLRCRQSTALTGSCLQLIQNASRSLNTYNGCGEFSIWCYLKFKDRRMQRSMEMNHEVYAALALPVIESPSSRTAQAEQSVV
jgi:hypothetical protein